MNRVRRIVQKLPKAVTDQFKIANKENAELVAAVARALISQRSGASRSAITTAPGADGGTIIDFGPLSKILEGGTEERFTKDGVPRGRGPARPFVNPAFAGTKKRRTARNREAIRTAIAKSKNG